MSSLPSNDKNPYRDLEPGYESVGEYYDLFADNTDLPFYIECAKQHGSPILDLAAGTGRVTFALANEGFEIVALEQSQSMLSIAQKKLREASPEVARRITLVEGSMIDFSFDKKFSLIIVPNSFGHVMNTNEQLSTLKCVREHLLDNGRFVLDLYPAALQYQNATFDDTPVQLENGCTVSRSGKIQSDFSRQLMRVDLQYTVRNSDGAIIDKVNVVSGASLIFNREADLLIRLSGFVVEDIYGDFGRSPYMPDSGRRIFILHK